MVVAAALAPWLEQFVARPVQELLGHALFRRCPLLENPLSERALSRMCLV
jgi:hypothetical protein